MQASPCACIVQCRGMRLFRRKFGERSRSCAGSGSRSLRERTTIVDGLARPAWKSSEELAQLHMPYEEDRAFLLRYLAEKSESI